MAKAKRGKVVRRKISLPKEKKKKPSPGGFGYNVMGGLRTRRKTMKEMLKELE